ncbi:MAG: hypothetical protein EOP04_02535 [Proteobacteria bacterium]|nr:MAG: hypothetical protein EOP04_02535 [Pseudomonadota bacterium]
MNRRKPVLCNILAGETDDIALNLVLNLVRFGKVLMVSSSKRPSFVSKLHNFGQSLSRNAVSVLFM